MIVEETVQVLPIYNEEVGKELLSILDFWMCNTLDLKKGGFIGTMDNEGRTDYQSPKGVVLNSRILWTFSSAYQHTGDEKYLDIATRAYHYLVDHFLDRKYGGVYWSVDGNGNPLETKKQIYGLAFCIYGLAEYYKACDDNVALHIAKDIYDKIEQYSFDKAGGGYLEAFTQVWKLIDDLRLSEKDDNEKKTMNTHLHIIEAYANLYTVWPDRKLKEKITDLLEIFRKYFINGNWHLNLFMDEEWTLKSSLISYGHDIEAAWLLLKCAETIEDKSNIEWYSTAAIKIADAAIEGLDTDGGIWYEYEPTKDLLIKEKHFWPQAEAMIGFLNAFQLTGEEKYLHHSINSWEFIKNHLKDNDKGEWFWGVNSDYSIMNKEKAGFWKCPYHNSRACMEITKRISGLIKS